MVDLHQSTLDSFKPFNIKKNVIKPYIHLFKDSKDLSTIALCVIIVPGEGDIPDVAGTICMLDGIVLNTKR